MGWGGRGCSSNIMGEEMLPPVEEFSTMSEFVGGWWLNCNWDFSFVDEVMQTTYCEIELDKAKRDAFVYAIKNHYWYQMYIDDLPIWGE